MKHKLIDRPLWDLGKFELGDLVSGPGYSDFGAEMIHGRNAAGIRRFGMRKLDAIARGAGLTDYHLDDDDGMGIQTRDPGWHRIWWAKSAAERHRQGPWEWHQDGEPSNPVSGYIATWSNIEPTELRVRYSHKPVPTKAGHLYLFDNLYFDHRATMPDDRSVDRWFLRGYFEPKAETRYTWHDSDLLAA